MEGILNEWLQFENLDNEIKAELSVLKEKENYEEIKKIFGEVIKFGTGGMRGIMGAGTNRINNYTIHLASWKLSKSLKPKDLVVIAYDTRKNSKRYAIEAAKTLCENGIKVRLFKDEMPTPLLSFAVRYYDASAGIVITASHNPKEYNGFKLYNSEGCQMIPEEIQKIINIKEEKNILEITKMSDENLLSHNLFNFIDNDLVLIEYLSEIEKVFMNFNIKKSSTDIDIVYSPLHGAGYESLRKGFDYFSINNVRYVEKQIGNNGLFPTIRVPNPEQEECFNESLKIANKYDSDLIVLTDPDCDRVGVAVKNGENYDVINGNDLGVLLVYFICNSNQLLHAEDKFVKTIVTSDLGKKIINDFGGKVEETLTGFKYIGNKISKFENSKNKFIFGYEESFGYLLGDVVRDKDGVVSTLLIILMAQHYKQSGKNLVEILEDIHTKYGYYNETQLSYEYVGLNAKQEMNEKMEILNDITFLKSTFEDLLIFENYNERKSYNFISNEHFNLQLPKSDVIKLIFIDQSWIAIRPSGTEPKLKIYISTNDICKNKSIDKMKLKTESIKKVLNF